MSLSNELVAPAEVKYPASDGQPIADNTLQFEWISLLKWNLETHFITREDVFVAGDLLWYPERGNNKLRVAPDVLVVFGRPKGYRGSYRQWEEDGIPPQVVMEVHSPSNTIPEMLNKLRFYGKYGVEEFYYVNPEEGTVFGWQRNGEVLTDVGSIDVWTSPLLGIRFHVENGIITVLAPDGQPFRTWIELDAERLAEQQRADAEQQRADAAQQRADAAQQRAEQLAARLRALGMDPDIEA